MYIEDLPGKMDVHFGPNLYMALEYRVDLSIEEDMWTRRSAIFIWLDPGHRGQDMAWEKPVDHGQADQDLAES